MYLNINFIIGGIVRTLVLRLSFKIEYFSYKGEWAYA